MSSRGGRKHKGTDLRSNKIINASRTIDKKKNPAFRDRATINRLKMYKTKVNRDKDGKFLGGAFMSKTPDEKVKRIAPDRRWFGTCSFVSQSLCKFYLGGVFLSFIFVSSIFFVFFFLDCFCYIYYYFSSFMSSLPPPPLCPPHSLSHPCHSTNPIEPFHKMQETPALSNPMRSKSSAKRWSLKRMTPTQSCSVPRRSPWVC